MDEIELREHLDWLLERVKYLVDNQGKLADALYLLSKGVSNLSARIDPLQDHVTGDREGGDPFVVPLVEETRRIEEEARGWYIECRDRLDVDQRHLSILDDASLEREEALRARVAELEEKVTRLAAIVANQQEAIVNLTHSKAG